MSWDDYFAWGTCGSHTCELGHFYRGFNGVDHNTVDIKCYGPTPEPPKPLFGGWTPTYENDLCKGGHPPQSVVSGKCRRCSRLVDERRCLCGDPAHRGGLSRSMCPTRMRFDQRDAELHADLFNERGELIFEAEKPPG